MNPPRFTHYGLSCGDSQASEVETGRAEFGVVRAAYGSHYYWRGNLVGYSLWLSLRKVDYDLRQAIYDAHMKADALSEHDSSAS